MSNYEPEDQLTTEEEARFASLSRIADVDEVAEERTVSALRNLGLIHSVRRPGLRWPITIIAGIAAALLLFVSGVAYGKQLAMRDLLATSPSVEVPHTGPDSFGGITRVASESSRESSASVSASVTPASVHTIIWF